MFNVRISKFLPFYLLISLAAVLSRYQPPGIWLSVEVKHICGAELDMELLSPTIITKPIKRMFSKTTLTKQPSSEKWPEACQAPTWGGRPSGLPGAAPTSSQPPNSCSQHSTGSPVLLPSQETHFPAEHSDSVPRRRKTIMVKLPGTQTGSLDDDNREWHTANDSKGLDYQKKVSRMTEQPRPRFSNRSNKSVGAGSDVAVFGSTSNGEDELLASRNVHTERRGNSETTRSTRARLLEEPQLKRLGEETAPVLRKRQSMPALRAQDHPGNLSPLVLWDYPDWMFEHEMRQKREAPIEPCRRRDETSGQFFSRMTGRTSPRPVSPISPSIAASVLDVRPSNSIRDGSSKSLAGRRNYLGLTIGSQDQNTATSKVRWHDGVDSSQRHSPKQASHNYQATERFSSLAQEPGQEPGQETVSKMMEDAWTDKPIAASKHEEIIEKREDVIKEREEIIEESEEVIEEREEIIEEHEEIVEEHLLVSKVPEAAQDIIPEAQTLVTFEDPLPVPQAEDIVENIVSADTLNAEHQMTPSEWWMKNRSNYPLNNRRKTSSPPPIIADESQWNHDEQQPRHRQEADYRPFGSFHSYHNDTKSAGLRRPYSFHYDGSGRMDLDAFLSQRSQEPVPVRPPKRFENTLVDLSPPTEDQGSGQASDARLSSVQQETIDLEPILESSPVPEHQTNLGPGSLGERPQPQEQPQIPSPASDSEAQIRPLIDILRSLDDENPEDPFFSTANSVQHLDPEASHAAQTTTAAASAAADHASTHGPAHDDPTTAQKIQECVEQLRMLGYGSFEDGGNERLVVYAQASEGDLEDAVDLIEEEREAWGEMS